MTAGEGVLVHGSTVSVAGRGLLILGRSGSGKSGLVLQLMAFGAELVADDRTRVVRRGDAVMATSPDTIHGRVEARGVGILAAAAGQAVPLALVADLDRTEKARLPEQRSHDVLGVALPLLFRVDAPHFPAALLQWLKAGRIA
ncbi:serine kinase [Haematobacter genomosp. 1]|uniref:Serine kinase n=1 Tax=Haematobacter genomosp. 1 TaxID=366618 RepID=A0A212A8G4_9RHOB|nr:serine kinase [Haematobacter genomosp. 1]